MYYNILEQLNLKPDEVIEYLRKSRTDDPSLSVEEVLAKHETILDEWAVRNFGATVPEENKYREVVSGETIADRPEVQKILKRIESPKYKAILIVEVQRLSRGDLEDAGRLIKLLRYTNTIVITPQKVYDLSDEYDRDIFERELKRGNEYLEYQKKIMGRGILLSVSQGNYLASVAPYGYEKTIVMDGKRKCPTLKPHEEQAPVLYSAYELFFVKDWGLAQICYHFDDLGIKPPKGEYWMPHSLRDILSNPANIGKVRWNWRKTITVVEDSEIIKTRPKTKEGDYLLFDGKHPAIVPEEWYYGTLEKLGRSSRAKPQTKVRNPLAGIVYCSCGYSMTYRTYKDKEGRERNLPRLICDNQAHCGTGSCTYDEMEKIVVDILTKSIADFEIQLKNENGNNRKAHEQLIKSLEKKLSDLEAKELSQWEAQSNPDPAQRMPGEIFKKLNEKLLKEKEETTKALYHARETIPSEEVYKERIARFSEALVALKDPSVSAQEKNRLLKACIVRITYNRQSSHRPAQSTPEHPTKRGGWAESPIEVDVKLKL